MVSDEDCYASHSRRTKGRITQGMRSVESSRRPHDRQTNAWARRAEGLMMYPSPACAPSMVRRKPVSGSMSARQPAPSSYSSVLAASKAASLRSRSRSTSPGSRTLRRSSAFKESAWRVRNNTRCQPPVSDRRIIPTPPPPSAQLLAARSQPRSALVAVESHRACDAYRTSSNSDSLRATQQQKQQQQICLTQHIQGNSKRIAVGEAKEPNVAPAPEPAPSPAVATRIPGEKRGEKNRVSAEASVNVGRSSGLKTAPMRERNRRGYEKPAAAAAVATAMAGAEVVLHAASPARTTPTLSVADLLIDGKEDGGPERISRRYTGSGDCRRLGKGRGSTGDIGVRRSSFTSTRSAPNVVSDSLASETLAWKERKWNRERAQLLTVIKLQHKKLTRSFSDGTSKSSGTTPPSASVGTAGARVTMRTATPRSTQIPPFASRMLLTSPPLTPTALSFADDPIIMTRDGWGAAGSAAGTTNICTSNEDAYSTGPDEEECFPFSSSERTQLLCKVEMQREEAARARSSGSGSFSNNRGSAAVAGQSSVGVSGKRRSRSGRSGNIRVKQREDGPARSEGDRVRTGVQTRLGEEDAMDAATAAPAVAAPLGTGKVSLASPSPHSAAIEGRLENLEVHIADVLRRLVTLEEGAVWSSHERIYHEQATSIRGLSPVDMST